MCNAYVKSLSVNNPLHIICRYVNDMCKLEIQLCTTYVTIYQLLEIITLCTKRLSGSCNTKSLGFTIVAVYVHWLNTYKTACIDVLQS